MEHALSLAPDRVRDDKQGALSGSVSSHLETEVLRPDLWFSTRGSRQN